MRHSVDEIAQHDSFAGVEHRAPCPLLTGAAAQPPRPASRTLIERTGEQEEFAKLTWFFGEM